jgi:pre-mRNA-processing factor 19
LTELTGRLSSTRKKRKPSPEYATPAALASYVQKSHVPSLHSTKPPGITTIDLSKDGNVVVTGGADKTVQLFDLAESKVLGTCKGHTKAITHIALREETPTSVEGAASRLIVSGSADKTVRVWGEDDAGKWSSRHVFKDHSAEITGLGLHPSGAYVAAGSLDSTWSLYDLDTFSVVSTYSPIEGTEGGFAYSSFGMHPDGLLYGGGTKDGLVRVWDARVSSALAATVEVRGKEINSLDFSENGYYLATSSVGSEAEIAIVDLRKLSILSSWTLPADHTVSEVKFDPSAQFLGVAGTDYRVYANKSWKELMTFDDNAGVLSAARWGVHGQEVVLGGMDRSLRVLGVKE